MSKFITDLNSRQSIRHPDVPKKLSFPSAGCADYMRCPAGIELCPPVENDTPKFNIKAKKRFIIPDCIFTKIVEFLISDPGDSELLKAGDACRDTLAKIFRYWSLKKEDRNGAPLSRRLYPEPLVATRSVDMEMEKAREERNRAFMNARDCLESALKLATAIKQREELKFKKTQIQIELCRNIISPVTAIIRPILETIKCFDKNGFFKNPVSEKLVPDYYNYVKFPMDFTTLSAKLERFEYEYNYELFERDLDLIWTNCIFYNKSETDYSKAAHRYRKRSLHHIINSRSEVLKKKLITSAQWDALLKARCFDLQKSREKSAKPVQENVHSVFADQHFSPDNKAPAVSLGHSLLSSVSTKVFDLLWEESNYVTNIPVDLESIFIFEPQHVRVDDRIHLPHNGCKLHNLCICTLYSDQNPIFEPLQTNNQCATQTPCTKPADDQRG